VRWSPRWTAALVIAFIVLGTAGVLFGSGFDVAAAGAALVRGAAGSWYAVGSGTLVRATPLILTGLAVAVAFRAGVFNIGAEGQFLVGAAAATAVALTLGSEPSIIVIPALLARYKLADTPLFERLKQQDQISKLPSFEVVKAHAKPILLLALISAFQQMDGYVSGTYVISFMSAAGIPLATSAIIIFISRIGDLGGVTVSGPAADLLKRKTVAYVAILLTTVLSVPFVIAILNHNIFWVVILQFLITFFGIGILHGLAPILTSESFPTKYRYSGTGIAYNLSAILGGMIAPSLLAGLIGQDVAGKWYYVPVVYGVYCVVAFVALFFLRETRDIPLEELDRQPALKERAIEAAAA